MSIAAIAVGSVRVGVAACTGTSEGRATELTPANIEVAREIGDDETAAVSVLYGSVIDKRLSIPVRFMPGGAFHRASAEESDCTMDLLFTESMN
jgi:hypothetical protein